MCCGFFGVLWKCYHTHALQHAHMYTPFHTSGVINIRRLLVCSNNPCCCCSETVECYLTNILVEYTRSECQYVFAPYIIVQSECFLKYRHNTHLVSKRARSHRRKNHNLRPHDNHTSSMQIIHNICMRRRRRRLLVLRVCVCLMNIRAENWCVCVCLR